MTLSDIVKKLRQIKGHGLQLFLVELSPDLAADLLTAHGKNRRLSTSMIERYSGGFTKDTIIYQPLLVSSTGRLIDGQHRCQSVIDSGITIRCVVITGVPDQAWDELDGGKPRSLSDVLSAMGNQNVTTLSAIVVWLAAYGRGLVDGGNASRGVPRSEYLELFEKHKPGLTDAAMWITAHRELGQVLNQSVVGFVYFMTSHYAQELAEFWNKIETGVGLSKDEPAALLRNAFLKDGRAGRKMSRIARLCMTIKAVNAELRGTKVGVLRFSPDEEIPTLVAEYGKPIK